MAARPNTLRTLIYGQKLAHQHLARLTSAIEMAENILQQSQLLTAEEIDTYKDCIRTAKKQSTLFSKVYELELPEGDTATPRRKRGRPSKAELAELAETRTPKKRGRPKKVTADADAEPAPKKRRGRPPKVEVTDAPKKRRGRPPKAKKTEDTISAVEKPKRKRGRPRKDANSVAAAATPVVQSETPKRKRGRPKGSKNKPKELDTDAVAA